MKNSVRSTLVAPLFAVATCGSLIAACGDDDIQIPVDEPDGSTSSSSSGGAPSSSSSGAPSSSSSGAPSSSSSSSGDASVQPEVDAGPDADATTVVVLDQAISTNENTAVSISLGAGWDGGALTYVIATQPTDGVLSGTGAEVTYTPNQLFKGIDTFTFQALDGAEVVARGTITITVTLHVVCGDGIVEPGVEGCDDGNQDNTDGCLDTCLLATCGDGIVQADVEECDDGNQDNTDGCLLTCKNATCGDGFTEVNVEECDDANANNGDACVSTCKNATCGDGFTQADVEECDDANASNTDACLSTCKTATCGDGFTQADVEQCDDGNADSTDGCTSTCKNATCGDGFTQAGVEQCDDGNVSNLDACTNVCKNAVCGDGFIEAGVEECDDANTSDDDGCSHTCKNDGCGDGKVQLALGEECDDGNVTDGDGCSAACTAAALANTASVKVSAELSCNTGVATATRKIAVDGSGRIYTVFQCGADAYLSMSTDQGVSFSAPLLVSATQTAQVGVVATLNNVAYIVLLSTSGQVTLRNSTDHGATWTAPSLIGTASNTSTGISCEAFNDEVWVGFESAGGVTVAYNAADGAGPFRNVIAPLTTADFDLRYDPRTKVLGVVASSPPSFRILLSNDKGATFAGEVNPPGQEFFSDWAFGNGQIFVSGTNIGLLGNSTQLYVIPQSAPTTSTAVAGLPQVSTLQSRSLAADISGNSFVASTLNVGGTVGGVRLDRLPAGTTTFTNPARTLSSTGTQPSVSPLPGNQGAAVLYTETNAVWATVQKY